MSINESQEQLPVIVEVYSGSKNTYETNKNRYVTNMNETVDVNLDMTVMSLNKTGMLGTLQNKTFQKKGEQSKQDPYGSSVTTEENEE
jgi:hypothetical protein